MALAPTARSAWPSVVKYGAMGGDRRDGLGPDGEVGLAVGGEVRRDVRLVVRADLLLGVPAEELPHVVDGRVGIVVDQLQGAPLGPHDGLDGGAVRVDVGRVDHQADGRDLKVVADPGHQLPAVLGRDGLGRHRAADVGRVDRALLQPAQVHTVVAGRADHELEVALRVEAGLAQRDPGEAAGRRVARVHRQPLMYCSSEGPPPMIAE